jgi:ABC-type polysaccharide/polyol phosphate export permease
MFFAQTTMGAMTSVAWNGALMKRVRVPSSIFVVSSAISGVVNLGLAFIPLVAVMIAVGAPFHLTMFFLPVSVLILATFTTGVAMLLFPLSIYFADTREMYQVLINALFYLTPIMYPLSVVPANVRWLITWNPLHHLLLLFRKPLYDGVLPTAGELGVCVALAVAAVALGWGVFRKMAPGFFAHI